MNQYGDFAFVVTISLVCYFVALLYSIPLLGLVIS